MAGVLFRQVVSEYTLTTTEKAISQLIAAANHGFYVNSVLLEFDDAADTTTGVGQVTLRLHSDAGTGGVTQEPFLTGADAEAIQTTGLEGTWATTEPAHGNIIARKNFKITTNTPAMLFTFTRGAGTTPTSSGNSYSGGRLKIAGGTRFGVEIFGPTSVSAATVLCTIEGEE
jgi:hypothetical protein